MRIGINCGHTNSKTAGSGAVGYLNESNETREVGYRLMDKLRLRGHEVVDCTNDIADSALDNLQKICKLANKQSLDMFVSIHFNSGGGVGCEAYTNDGKNAVHAQAMLDNLSQLGFRNRGIKNGSNLYVIKNTTARAVLLEVCFTDSWIDAELYTRLGAEKIAEAISEAIPLDEEELSMTKYEELKGMILTLTEEVNKLKNPMIYNYIDDNMPVWARSTIEKLVRRGVLNGNENGLNLTEEMLRVLTICDRLGLYDK